VGPGRPSAPCMLGGMVRLIGLLAIALILSLLATWAIRDIRRIAATRPRRRPARPRRYDWERRRDRVSRRIKTSPGPPEPREKILAFLETRDGVEAFIEPRTAVSPLSVVLVADDGEWVRFAVRDDAFIREVARARGLRVYDAARTGYPERMRRYRKNGGTPPPDAPGPSA